MSRNHKAYLSIFLLFGLVIRPDTCGALTQEAVDQIFETDLAPLSFSKVWGPIDSEYFPWVKSLHFGWIYLDEKSTVSGYWIWLPNIGWIYSSRGIFPEAFYSNQNDWVLFDLSEKTRIKLWNYSVREWQYFEREGFEVYGYNEIPDDLQNIEIERLGLRSQHHIRIGKYLWYESIVDPVNISENLYIYNSDGYFYPHQNLHQGDIDLTKYVFFNPWRYRLEVSEGYLVITRENILWEEEDESESYLIDSP